MEFPSTIQAIYIASIAVTLVVVEKVFTQRLLNRQGQELKGLLQEWQGLVAAFKALRQQREAAERQKSEMQLKKRKLKLQLDQLGEQILSQEEKATRQLAMGVQLDNLVNQP